ncbi:hypothetical protein NHQ30_003317 [Ciborinia camelliae]|nr:hypothetical protein NHQ30_003317 [Ciborinia camelliae]
MNRSRKRGGTKFSISWYGEGCICGGCSKASGSGVDDDNHALIIALSMSTNVVPQAIQSGKRNHRLTMRSLALLLSLVLASQYALTIANILSIATPTDVPASPTHTSPPEHPFGPNNIDSAVVVPVIVASVSIFVAFLLILCLKVPVPERFLRSARDDDSTLRPETSHSRFSWLRRKRRSRPTIWPHSVYNGGEFESRKCGELEMRVMEDIPGFPGPFRNMPLSQRDTEKMSQARMEEEAELRIREMLERMNPEDRAWASEQLIYGQADELRDKTIGAPF